MKDFQVTANCPKGRLLEIDSQGQWNAAIAKVLTKERDLIGRLPKSGTVNQGASAANERLANKAWAKCSTENSQEHEYKRQPRYSAD